MEMSLRQKKWTKMVSRQLEKFNINELNKCAEYICNLCSGSSCVRMNEITECNWA